MGDRTQQEPMIRITGLKKEYRLGEIDAASFRRDVRRWWDRKHGRETGEPEKDVIMALDGIDLTVRRGERLGILGPNGAGKSTLLKIISRITSPTAGRIELRGRVGSMLEVGTGFNAEMTARENIFMSGALLGMSRAEIAGKLPDIVAFSGTEMFLDTPVKRFSSGMYVKLAFAVTAHLDSEIMIMDEVLAVGDMEFQKKCLDRMRRSALDEGRTILYVSHNVNTIRHLCSRAIVLDKGHLIHDGDVDRAIALYLGGQETPGARVVFGEGYRPYDAALRMNRRFEMLELAVTDRECPSYRPGDRPVLELTLDSLRDFDRVGFRFELWYQDGQKVGTMLSGSFVRLEEGRHRVRITMDLTHLRGGRYRADLVAYQFDEHGNEDILDGVYPGFVFDLTDCLSPEDPLDWHHQYWGHVRLHDLQAERS